MELQTLNTLQERNTLRIYYCGGVGLKTGSTTEFKLDNRGYALVQPCYIDTSKANRTSLINDDLVYLIGDGSGSGGDKRKHASAIKECVNDILKQFKPGSVNVIVAAGSGASGSSTAHMLVDKMLQREERFVVIVVGDTTSANETNLTKKMLLGLSALANKHGKPVPCCYFENSPETPQSLVNKQVQLRIAMLAMFFSGTNYAIDPEDIRNFLDYSKLTSHTADLVWLEVFHNSEQVLPNSCQVKSLLSLTTEGTDATPPFLVEYRKAGIINPELYHDLNKARAITMPLHLILADGYFHMKMEQFDRRLAEFEEARSVKPQKPLHVSAGNDMDDDCFFA